MDERVNKLAKIIVDYSVNVKKGERVIIAGSTMAEPLIKEIYKLVILKGAYPSVRMSFSGQTYTYYNNSSKEQLNHFPENFDYEVRNSDVYIGIGAPDNARELANIDPKKIAVRTKVTRPITDYIVNGLPKMRRVTMGYPIPSLAQDADMSTDEYEDFFYKSTIQDWPKLRKEMNKVKKFLDKGKIIRIVGKDTDLKIGIKNRQFVIDAGEENMPGGEIFNAPLENTVEGHIRFTYPAIKAGKEVTNIYLEFKKGKVVKATADKNEDFLHTMINTDKGSCYLGELGIGFNPKVTKFTKRLLFDEKIGGTIHLALGMAYKQCKGTNKSAIHWDIVKDLRKEGGAIYLDGKVVQKNGKWLI